MCLPEQRDTRLSPGQARDQTKHLSMIVDSGAEVPLVCPTHSHFLTNVTKLSVPLQLGTAGSEVRKMDISTRCPEGYGVLKCETRTFWFSGLPRRRRGTTCFLCFAQLMEVIVACIMMCAEDIWSSIQGARQHRRQDDRVTAGAGKKVCADLTGRLSMAYNGSEHLLVALRRETRFSFVTALLTNAARRSRMQWSTCSCCCVEFGSSTVMRDGSHERSRRLADSTHSPSHHDQSL